LCTELVLFTRLYNDAYSTKPTSLHVYEIAKHFVIWWPFVLSSHVISTTGRLFSASLYTAKFCQYKTELVRVTMQEVLLSRYRRAGIPWAEQQFYSARTAKPKKIPCIMHHVGNKPVYDAISLREPYMPSNDVLW